MCFSTHWIGSTRRYEGKWPSRSPAMAASVRNGSDRRRECLAVTFRSDSPAGWTLQVDRNSSRAPTCSWCRASGPSPTDSSAPKRRQRAVPALAFDVGGIREWLIDSETGRLAQLTADAAGSLSRALEDCLADRERLSRWGRQAYTASQARSLGAHIDALEHALVRRGRCTRPRIHRLP